MLSCSAVLAYAIPALGRLSRHIVCEFDDGLGARNSYLLHAEQAKASQSRSPRLVRAPCKTRMPSDAGESREACIGSQMAAGDQDQPFESRGLVVRERA